MKLFRKWKYWLPLFAVAALATSSAAQATGGHGNDNGGGHTPITVCHKPGTPAEQQLTFDDNALGRILVNGHLGHGDTLGPCPTPPPPPPVECPEGYEQQESPEGTTLCVKTVEVEVPGPEKIVYVDRFVDRVVYVDRVVTVPVEKIVEVPVEVIKTVEKPVDRIVTKTVVKWKTKVKKVVQWKTKTKIVKVSGSTTKCVCPTGYRLWKGRCAPIVRGNG